MSERSGPDTTTLRDPLSLVVVAAILVAVALIDPLTGVGGAILVGLCWAVLGPIPAFAVGEFVVAALGAQPPLVVAGLQLPLGAILLTASLDGAAPSRQAAGAVGALVGVGAVTAGAWFWSGSAAVAALGIFGTVALGLYAVYRYETVGLGPVSTQGSEQ